MSLAPLLAASPLVQLHAAAALAALGLGAWQLAGPKGTVAHRRIGWVWAGLMAVVALSSFGITSPRNNHHYSFIHALSLFTLAMLPIALLHARRGRIVQHRIRMLSLYFGALVIAGAFTLMPERIMGRVVFG